MLNFILESLKDSKSLSIDFNTFNLKLTECFGSSLVTNQYHHIAYKIQPIYEWLDSFSPFCIET